MKSLGDTPLSPLAVELSLASQAGEFRQTTPRWTSRYDKGIKVVPRNTSIPAGTFSSSEPVPRYLPPRWSAHIHPEGQLYFHKDATISVVTEADLNDPKVLEKVEYWIAKVEGQLLKRSAPFTGAVELFIAIDDVDCSMYFIDHRSQTSFWMDSVETSEMGIEPVASLSHLKLNLHEFYWNHVEFFPTHLSLTTFPPNALEELIGVFSHALADHMTSRNSTFPYNEHECTTLLKLLRSFRDHPQDGYSRSTIARLWQLIYKSRIQTYYGESNARLSREQSIIVDAAQESNTAYTVTSILSFKTSDYYVSQLNNLYIDQIVYVHQWQPFMQKCLKDWRSLLYLSLMALLSHLLLEHIPTIRILTILSSSCFGISFVSSSVLIHRHDTLADASAADALSYLSDICSTQFKFQGVAFIYAIPQAMFFWGILGFVANCIVALSISIAGEAHWKPYFLGLSGLCLLAALVFHDLTSGTKILSFCHFKWCKTDKSDRELSPV